MNNWANQDRATWMKRNISKTQENKSIIFITESITNIMMKPIFQIIPFNNKEEANLQ